MAGTSLAEQLKKLAAPQTSILVHRKKRLSLLFDPKDAADINRETFYKIGKFILYSFWFFNDNLYTIQYIINS